MSDQKQPNQGINNNQQQEIQEEYAQKPNQSESIRQQLQQKQREKMDEQNHQLQQKYIGQQQEKAPQNNQTILNQKNQQAQLPAKNIEKIAQRKHQKQSSQQKQLQQNPQPTQDDINQFIISIKSSFKGQIYSLLKKFGKQIVNRIQPQTRQPSLYFAAVLGDENTSHEIMEALIKNGANLAYKDQHGQTVLFYVCRQGKQKCVQLLLDYGLKIEDVDSYGQTPIYYAASQNRLNIIEKFANNKQLLNNKDQLAGHTPLFYAAKKGHLQMCKLLVQKGTDPTIIDNSGKTALENAKRAKYQQVADYLNGQLKKIKDQNTNLAQNEEKINAQNQSSQIQDNKKNNKKKQVSAPKQSYKIVFMNASGEVHDLTQQEVKQLVKGNKKLQQYLANPQSIPQQQIDSTLSQQSWQKVAQKLISNCWKLKGGFWFHQPVDPVRFGIMDYFDIITKPMDLGTVKKKLNHNAYEKAQDFVDDMRLVWSNCYRYNGEHHDISKCAKQVETTFEQGIKSFGLSKYL